MAFNNSYGMVFARAVDTFFGSLIWRDYAITISSMTGLALRKANPPKWARVLGWCLNRIQANHCDMAIAADIQRAQTALLILGGTLAP